MVINVTSEDFDDKVLKSDKLVVVDFWAVWCMPCLVLSKTMEKLSQNYTTNIVVAKCNVDENPSIAAKYGIKSIPAVLFFKDGNLLNRMIGAQPELLYDNMIEKLQ